MPLPNLILAWQGAEDDAIYYTTSPLDGTIDGPFFPYAQVIPGIEGGHTSSRPSLFRTIFPPWSGASPTVGMAWKGSGNDVAMYGAIWDSDPSGPPTNIWVANNFSGQTTWGPAFTQYNGGLYLVWKGSGTDTRIWSGACGENFYQAAIGGVPTNAASALSPAIVTFGNQMIMVWRGEGTIDGLFWAISDPTKSWSDPNFWHHLGPVPNAGTTDIPSLTVFDNTVFLAYKGLDTNIWINKIVDTGDIPGFTAQWQQKPWAVAGVGTTNGPAICTFGDKLFMAWKGVGGDTSIWYSQSRSGDAEDWWIGTPGQVQRSIPGVGTSYGPAAFSYTG